jgi:hypothetical protein
MIPRYNEYSEREHLQREINQLKNELSVLKKDMEKFKDFMNTNASFTDFKRFKMVEEEEKSKPVNYVTDETGVLTNEQLLSLNTIYTYTKTC